MEIKKALEEAGGDEAAAGKILKDLARSRAGKKKERKAGEGMIFSYIHSGGKVGVLLDLRCETDFVARTDTFQKLGKELCLQIVSMDPDSGKELFGQEYIRDPSRKVADLVGEAAGSLGENLKVERFVRYVI